MADTTTTSIKPLWTSSSPVTLPPTPTTLSPSHLHHSLLHWPLTGSDHNHDVVIFPRQSKEDYVLVGLLHTVGLVLALIGNCSVIVIIARTKRLHTPSSLLVLVLATSDLLLSLFWNLVPLLLTFDDGVNRMLTQSQIACNVIGFAWQTMLTISTLTHAFVAFDRYLFIVHPMKYQVYVTIRATSFLTCGVIVIACLLASLTFISQYDFRFLQVAGMCIGSPLWSVLYLFLVFIPSLTTAVFAYQRIWRLCASIFKQEDMSASRGRSSRVCFSNQALPLSLSSSRNQSRSDLSAIVVDQGDFKMVGGGNNFEDMPSSSTFHKDSVDNDANSISNSNSKPAEQKHILTTVMTTHLTSTKVTRKNTTTTTTIESSTPRGGPSLPLEDPEKDEENDQSLLKERIIERKISEIKEVEVEKTTSTERQRTQSVTVHTRCSTPGVSFPAQQQPSDVQSNNDICINVQTLPSNSYTSNTAGFKPCHNNKNKRSYSKDSILPFIIGKNKSHSPNPFIVTTAAESTSTLSNIDDNLSASHCFPSTSANTNCHLGIMNPFSVVQTTPPQATSYETITKKLFGSEAILPSLLYVAILMPLSMQPVSSNYKHRRLRVCLLIGLPVLIMAVSFLPFPGSLIYVGYRKVAENGAGMILIKLICHMTYALVPSLTSLLLCLNNRPYRRALRQMLRCRCV